MSINRISEATKAQTYTGSVTAYAGSTAPTGWLLCDATAYDGTMLTYAALWAVIGTTYGGTGQSSFKVPDLRGRTAVGSGNGTATGHTNKTLGSTPTTGAGGEETHTLTGGESGTTAHLHPITNVQHTHGQNDHAHTTYDSSPYSGIGYCGGGDWNAVWWTRDLWYNMLDWRTNTNQPASTGITATQPLASPASGTAHNIMQPFTVVNYIIKF